MTVIPFRKPSRPVATWVISLTALHLAFGAVTHALWLHTGDTIWLKYFFDYQGTLFLVGLGAAEVVLSLGALRRFESGQPLRAAWFFLSVAAVCHLAGGILVALLRAGTPVTLQWAVTWPNDLLLAILLFEAILLRRSALNMGWGLVAKVWGAFALAVFVSSLGSFFMWLTSYGYLSFQQAAVGWYAWYIAAAAFVLAPAYQLEASRTARARLEEYTDDRRAA